jgi:hypothetical protein
MSDPGLHLDNVGTVVEALRKTGFEPILVGGIALVILGSQRITRAFDFVVAQPGERLQSLVDVFYDRGFELASRVNDAGEVTATIDNRRVAVIRLRLDAPSSAYFFKQETLLRIDLLFDFPVPAASLVKDATRMKIRSYAFHVASEADLLRLKKIAHAQRSAPGDAQDIAFLEARQRRS